MDRLGVILKLWEESRGSLPIDLEVEVELSWLSHLSVLQCKSVIDQNNK